MFKQPIGILRYNYKFIRQINSLPRYKDVVLHRSKINPLETKLYFSSNKLQPKIIGEKLVYHFLLIIGSIC